MSTAEIMKCQFSDFLKYLSATSTASRSCNYSAIFFNIPIYSQIFICNTNRTNLSISRNSPSVMSQLGLFILTACSGIFIYQFVIYQVQSYLIQDCATPIFRRSWTLKIKDIFWVKILCCHISGNLLLLHPEKSLQVLVGTLPGLDDCLCHRINVSLKLFFLYSLRGFLVFIYSTL